VYHRASSCRPLQLHQWPSVEKQQQLAYWWSMFQSLVWSDVRFNGFCRHSLVRVSFEYLPSASTLTSTMFLVCSTEISITINWVAPFHHRLAPSWTFVTCTSSITNQINLSLSLSLTHTTKHRIYEWVDDRLFTTRVSNQVSLQQSIEWHHSIIDRISCAPSHLVRRSINDIKLSDYHTSTLTVNESMIGLPIY